MRNQEIERLRNWMIEWDAWQPRITFNSESLNPSISSYAGLSTRPERKQRVHIRMCRTAPSCKVRTRCRLGYHLLFVLLLAWLTLLPVWGRLPHIWQTLAISFTSKIKAGSLKFVFALYFPSQRMGRLSRFPAIDLFNTSSLIWQGKKQILTLDRQIPHALVNSEQ